MNNILEKFENYRLYPARMVGYSKSIYRRENPENEVIFNANIFTSEGKIWHGDLDLTLDSGKLQLIANEVGESIFVLREGDGRFQKEILSFTDIAGKAIKIFNPS
jgi:hypothetical protein